MSEISIEMNIPLDPDGFLSRECPNCERQFKWKPISSTSDDTEGGEIESYYCPYCYQPAPPNAWWTKEQLEYAQQIAFKQVVEPQLEKLQKQINQLSNSSSLIQAKASISGFSEPDPELLDAIENLARIDFPCHLEGPIKVDKMWSQEIACFLCGIRYPIELVRELADEE